MSQTITDATSVREVAPLTADSAPVWPASIVAGIADYTGLTAAERRAHNLEWQRVRDPQAGIVQVPARVCCGFGLLVGEICHRCNRVASVDAATLAELESGTWSWSAPDTRVGA